MVMCIGDWNGGKYRGVMWAVLTRIYLFLLASDVILVAYF